MGSQAVNFTLQLDIIAVNSILDKDDSIIKMNSHRKAKEEITKERRESPDLIFGSSPDCSMG
jgi:hypothetical protein